MDRVRYVVYILAILVSLSLWFISVRAPLWLDETLSFSQICGGFSQIMVRQGGLSAPGYPYVLWFATKILGTSEIALRIPSIVAMLGAAYFLYRTARELFEFDVAVIATIFFCIHPLVIFLSIDVRPYAFAALALNAAMFLLIHSRHSDSNWLAAGLGITFALIAYFHLLFMVIAPAFLICYVAIKIENRTMRWQLWIALAPFAVAFIPAFFGLRFLFHTSSAHVWDEAPKLVELCRTLTPGLLPPYILLGAIFLAAATRHFDVESRLGGIRVLFCVSMALVPILILYVVSVETPIHIFVPRYRLVAVPGIALCWGLIMSRIDSRAIRLLFCVVVVAVAAYQSFSSPFSGLHGYTWKYALEMVQKDASADNAPVLICSDLPESDHMPMPANPKDSVMFAPLSYYRLSVPVVPLPRTLNQDAIRIASDFVVGAQQRHQRFLALGYMASYDTLHWLVEAAKHSYSVQELGTSNGIVVLEFTPLDSLGDSH
jgi:mannosyltransferase